MRAKDKDKPFKEWQAWQHKRATLRADGGALAAAGVVGGAAAMHQQQYHQQQQQQQQQQQHQLYAQHDEGNFQTPNPFYGQAGIRPMSAAFNNGNYGVDQQQQQQPLRGQINAEPRRFSNKFAPSQVPAPFFTPHLSSSSGNSVSVAPPSTPGGGAGGEGMMMGGGGARPASSRLPPALPSGRQFSVNTYASPRMSVSRKDEVADNLWEAKRRRVCVFYEHHPHARSSFLVTSTLTADCSASVCVCAFFMCVFSFGPVFVSCVVIFLFRLFLVILCLKT